MLQRDDFDEAVGDALVKAREVELYEAKEAGAVLGTMLLLIHHLADALSELERGTPVEVTS